MTSNKRFAVEVCCFNLPSVIAACDAEADRIELCEHRELDGVTPSDEFLKEVLAYFAAKRGAAVEPGHHAVCLPKIHVMLRPPPRCGKSMLLAGGDVFVVSQEEKDSMLSMLDASYWDENHVHGVVFGVLTYDSNSRRWCVDRAFVEALVAKSRSRGIHDICFHRAFDFVLLNAEGHDVVDEHVLSEVEALEKLGVQRILLSGASSAHATASDRMQRIWELATAVSPRMSLMPAGGITASGIASWLHFQQKKCGDDCILRVREFHGSFIVPSPEVGTLGMSNVDAIRAAVSLSHQS